MSETLSNKVVVTPITDPKLAEYIKNNTLTPVVDEKSKESLAFDLICEDLQMNLSGLTPDADSKQLLDGIVALSKSNTANRSLLFSFCRDIVDGAPQSSVYSSAMMDLAEIGRSSSSVSRFVSPKSHYREIDMEELALFISEHKRGDNLSDVVNRFMAEKKMTAPDVYRNANLSRQDFSRIMHPKSKGVSKTAVFNLVIGLRLNLDEAKKLLRSAGYAFNRSRETDLIIMYCIEQEIYDILKVSETLVKYTGKGLLASYEANVSDKTVK